MLMKIIKINDVNRNYFAFLWHALFLALAKNFTEVNTIFTSMILKAGGNNIHLGILTGILVGGVGFMQLFFIVFLYSKIYKKNYLIIGITLRFLSLFFLSYFFLRVENYQKNFVLFFIFFLSLIFSFSGAFAGISYTDILGKSLKGDLRKSFFTTRQIVNSIGILLTGFIVRELVKKYSYPLNYSILYFIAGFLLFLASLGFWAIKETPNKIDLDTLKKGSFFKTYIQIIKNDNNIKYYILLLNTMSFGILIIPFYVSYFKHLTGLTGKDIGNFLILQVLGMLVSSFIWKYILKKYNYKFLTRIYVFMGILVIFLAILLSKYVKIFPVVFFLGGFNLTAYRIISPGILLEISNDSTRSLYTAISGAGNLSLILIPLLNGLLIQALGYVFVYILSAIALIFSLFIIKKLNCTYSYL